MLTSRLGLPGSATTCWEKPRCGMRRRARSTGLISTVLTPSLFYSLAPPPLSPPALSTMHRIVHAPICNREKLSNSRLFADAGQWLWKYAPGSHSESHKLPGTRLGTERSCALSPSAYVQYALLCTHTTYDTTARGCRQLRIPGEGRVLDGIPVRLVLV